MKIFIQKAGRIFAAAGLIAGIGAGLVQYALTGDMKSALLIGLIAICLEGICLALIGLWFARFNPNRRWITTIHFLVMPLVGIVLAALTSSIAGSLIVGNWQELKPSPDPAVTFIKAEHVSLVGDNLFINTISGATYAYECVIEERCEWVQKEFAPTDYQGFPCDFATEELVAPASPGIVVDSLQSAICGVDGREITKFILLDDGRMYYWTKRSSFNTDVSRFMGFMFFGLVSGLAASFITMMMRKKRMSS